MARKVVVITGCDTGFGYLTALQLDRLSYQVVAICLSKQGCQNLVKHASSTLLALQGNVTEDADMNRIVCRVAELAPEGLYCLINNAGISDGSFIEWTEMSCFQAVMEVNFFGTVRVCKIFTDLLRLGQGRIINFSSQAGVLALPGLASYSSSKVAVEAFSDVLRFELAPWKIQVAIIEPGTFSTDIVLNQCLNQEKHWNNLSDEKKRLYGEDYNRKFLKLAQETMKSPPEDLVNKLVKIVQTPTMKHRYRLGYDCQFLLYPLSKMPSFFTDFGLALAFPFPRTGIPTAPFTSLVSWLSFLLLFPVSLLSVLFYGLVAFMN
eukprot:Lithocolla_globosa_v1_NODE_246_length_4873_cov_135.304068.p1 type:complete len:321 gc:universal NODE_246_length_4873_cov_135.304068:734-1696(+)